MEGILVVKLTKYQKARLQKFEWTPVETEVNGEIQNCAWISVNPEDGIIFQECIDTFGLTGEGEDVKLLVVGYQDGDEEDLEE
jgi:hypothetical protein